MSMNGVSDLLNEDYVLNRLVYINSAQHGYSEIMLNTHLAMFGDNNQGKTASLAGTKLLLYPETSLTNCAEKFCFEGRDGAYSTEESYLFYFPSPHSYIVLEVSNPEGKFCMVLYRNNQNWGYGRFFVPAEYEALRSVFWNDSEDSFPPDLSLSSVGSQLKSLKAIQVSDEKEIASLMFASFRDSPDRKRFCVIPLKDGDSKDAISAFKKIYQLAFDTGSSKTETLPTAIATLIDMGRSRDQEKLDANLIDLIEQHNQLLDQQEWLQKIENASLTWRKTKESFDESAIRIAKYSRLYRSVNHAVEAFEKSNKKRLSEIKTPFDDVSRQKHNLEENIKTSDAEQLIFSGATEQLVKQLVRSRNKLKKVKALKARYVNMPIDEILGAFNDEIRTLTESIKTLKEEDGAIKSLVKLNTRRAVLEENISGLESLAKETEETIFFQLRNEDAADVLHSLNSQLCNITSVIDPETKRTILDFASLLGKDGSGRLTFLESTLNEVPYNKFNIEEQRVKWVKSIENYCAELSKVRKDITVHHEAVKHDTIEGVIEREDADLNKAIKERDLIGGLEQLEKDTKETEVSLAAQQSKQQELENKNNEQKNKHSEIQREYSELSNKLTGIQKEIDSLEGIKANLKTAFSFIRPFDLQGEVDSLKEIKSEDGLEVLNQAKKASISFREFEADFNTLAIELPHSEIDPHKRREDLHEYNQLIKIHSTTFDTFEYEKTKHDNAKQSHNQLVNNQLSELKDSKALITNYISELNQDLNSKHVSNLSEIKLHVELNSNFLALLDTLDKHNIQDDSLLDPSFYSSLLKFVDKYFNKRTRRLKLKDIITSIQYQYTLAETNEVVTKSQSGGTTSTITAFVLAVLLKRITPNYVKLQIPIIVDEIGTLDGKNTSATIKQIAEHGFSIFCATPTFSPLVANLVGRWVSIDRFSVTAPLVKKCHMHILPAHIESFEGQDECA
ncbi:coiled-coil domain-containing protein [Alkalimarinus alittae]|uniref:Uncharacterized protein n=1 Tax=Alkalimarinus alittae TaxID=2961619 RepID=A0ABY6N536_9ALTE|nr:hypothetical protein [Alkalimarinus alittae]UZE97233.1 hypothetical protein NKI27_05650 [Alkalimarinus alittae]